GDEKLAIEDHKSAIGDEKLAIGDQKSAIGDEKLAIETVMSTMSDLKFNEPTRKNIEKIYFSIGANQVFGYTEVKDILHCSDSTARALIARLRDELKVITAVYGKGKAKYRFMKESEK
ncbi:MAG: hypothetical protein IKT21_06875, partial [Methanomicrobium sp.]|nr:hypothetical protein [Methanomicrobium sp.]